MAEAGTWRRCSACKKSIAEGALYWVCSVSTCNRKRTGLAFCSVTCWDVHLPGANHREAWAEERIAPKAGVEASAASGSGQASGGRRRIVRTESKPAEAPPVLVVASRLKDYVRIRSGGFNTSDRVLEPLSEIVRRICDQAIANARREGRMTVLERDIPDA